MRVVLADIEADGLSRACTELSESHYDVLGVPTDVSSEPAIQALADATLERFGRVDVIHSNAGVVAAGLVEEIPIEAWRWALDVDLWSVIYAARVFVPILKAQGAGHVINT